VKCVYVAGPFRAASTSMPGQQDHWGIMQNIMSAMALAREIWLTGYAVAICPHANTFCFQNTGPDDIWLKGDLELLRRCDVVLMTPDWLRSSGARVEEAYALAHGMLVFYAIEDCLLWLNITHETEAAT